MKLLEDSFGRRIDYLRLSVTDACNFRCAYCRPRTSGGLDASSVAGPFSAALDDGDLFALVERLASLGVRRVRVTGGEPLLRRGIAGLIARLAAIPGVEDLSMTTNGLLLADSVSDLAGAGLGRVNISLDSLRPERFREITGVDGLARIRRAVDAALHAGLAPVKLNVVVMRGVNDDEIPDFAALTMKVPLHVRFIELMPLGPAGFECSRHWVPLKEIRERCGALEPVGSGLPFGAGPAVYSRLPGGRGTVGFIGALSEKFCSDCNRLRLTAAGKLLSCLARPDPAVDLGALLRSGASGESLESGIRELVHAKLQSHDMVPGKCVPSTCMASIGG